MADPITLKRYFAAPAGEAEELLAGIFSEAEPLIRRIVRYRIGPGASGGWDLEDVCGEATVRLLMRLDDLRSQPDAARIEDFSAYVAAICHNTVNEHFRRVHPLRHRLRNKLRYLLKPDRGLDLWETQDGIPVCGRVGWRGRTVLHTAAPAALDWSYDPVGAVLEILDHAGGPIEFDDLIDALCSYEEYAAPFESVESRTASPEPNRDELLINRQCVRVLWDTILDLPIPQRAALLLNLRDAQGMNALVWLPAAGVASVRRIAEALSIPVDEFALLWAKLPLADLLIADRLGVTRQQVINLRAAARKRLARNLEARS